MSATPLTTSGPANGFDNLIVDVAAVFAKHPVSALQGPSVTTSGWDKLYRSRLLPLKRRLQLWDLAFLSNWDLGWFNDFNAYWTRVLGGRPLWHPQDIFFLKNLYRMRFQQHTLADTDNANVHLQAWQQPEVLYFLLHSITKRTASSDIAIFRKAQELRGKATGLSVLEYGCGFAPFTRHAVKFLPESASNHFWPTDLAMLPFHYAAWRLHGQANVHPHLLLPENSLQPTLAEPMDLIFCIQVFEHLNEPLQTVKFFHQLLKAGGVLVFDFLLTEGKGLDSRQGVEQQAEVLDFVRTNFELEAGVEITANKSLDLTFARKK